MIVAVDSDRVRATQLAAQSVLHVVQNHVHWECNLDARLAWNLALGQKIDVFVCLLARLLERQHSSAREHDLDWIVLVLSGKLGMFCDALVQPGGINVVVHKILALHHLHDVLSGGANVTSNGELLQGKHHRFARHLTIHTGGEQVTKLTVCKLVNRSEEPASALQSLMRTSS